MTDTERAAHAIQTTCDELCAFLLEKNACYGNSAFDPIGIFNKSGTKEQIGVRIDDKLSRLKRGSEFPGDDTVKDLAGYLIILIAYDKYAPNRQSSNPQG